MPTFRRVRRSIAALLLVLYLPGCGDSGGPESIAGTYTLQAVNGEGPPWGTTYYPYETIEVDGKTLVSEKKAEWVSGTLRLAEDRTCSLTDGWRVTERRLDPLTLDEVSTTVDTVYHTFDACTYTVTGSSVTFTFLNLETVITGTIAGHVLTIVWGSEMVFER